MDYRCTGTKGRASVVLRKEKATRRRSHRHVPSAPRWEPGAFSNFKASVNMYFKKTNSQLTKYHATTSRALDSAAYHEIPENNPEKKQWRWASLKSSPSFRKGSEVPDHSHDTNAGKHKAGWIRTLALSRCAHR